MASLAGHAALPLDEVRPDVADHREIVFDTGDLSVTVERQAWPLDALCGFAARNNPRRGYLVVSAVLGRHIPTAPSVMRATFRDLAARLDPDLPGPVLVVGLAEMGVCLGLGVHEEYRRRTGRRDVACLQSTRHVLDRPLLAAFMEPHSHAPFHAIYLPADPDVLRAVMTARSLVLVDDEASTGTTFVNLAAALLEALPQVESIATAVLTDWSGEDYLSRMPRPASAASLLSGRLEWTPRWAAPLPAALAPVAHEPHARLPNYGRLGRLEPVDLGGRALALARTLDLSPGDPVRVIGTGEFTFAPFRLAEDLEAFGMRVEMQATSRSPARIGGAIGSALLFADNYGEGLQHYLYNQAGRPPARYIICAETPAASVDPVLVEALGAHVVSLAEGTCAQSS